METTTGATLTTTSYAGFGQRLVAFIIDIILIGVVQSLIIAPILAVIGIGVASEIGDPENMTEAEALGFVGAMMGAMGTIMITIWAIQVLYFAVMESSKTQGSVGKMAMGIKVTDMAGERLSFGKALVRSLGKILSGMVFMIGYLIAAFTEKKQALHDLIASTLVLKK